MSKDKKIKLIAVNSGQDMELLIQKGVIDGDEEFYFTLCGTYKKQKMQVDFNYLTKAQFTQCIADCYNLLKDKHDN